MKTNSLNVRIQAAIKSRLKKEAKEKEVTLSQHVLDQIEIASKKIVTISKKK